MSSIRLAASISLVCLGSMLFASTASAATAVLVIKVMTPPARVALVTPSAS